MALGTYKFILGKATGNSVFNSDTKDGVLVAAIGSKVVSLDATDTVEFQNSIVNSGAVPNKKGTIWTAHMSQLNFELTVDRNENTLTGSVSKATFNGESYNNNANVDEAAKTAIQTEIDELTSSVALSSGATEIWNSSNEGSSTTSVDITLGDKTITKNAKLVSTAYGFYKTFSIANGFVNGKVYSEKSYNATAETVNGYYYKNGIPYSKNSTYGYVDASSTGTINSDGTAKGYHAKYTGSSDYYLIKSRENNIENASVVSSLTYDELSTSAVYQKSDDGTYTKVCNITYSALDGSTVYKGIPSSYKGKYLDDSGIKTLSSSTEEFPNTKTFYIANTEGKSEIGVADQGIFTQVNDTTYYTACDEIRAPITEKKFNFDPTTGFYADEGDRCLGKVTYTRTATVND